MNTGDTGDNWALNETFAILDRPFRVRTGSPFCAELIELIFGDCRITDTFPLAPTYVLDLDIESDRAVSSIVRDDRTLLRNADARSVVALLAWHVMNDAVSATSELFVVHAGSVIGPDGRAIVLPAASGSGKTTLTAGLIQAGCAYLSDEMAAFDPTSHRVIPVPRALSIKSGSINVLGIVVPSLLHRALEVLDGSFPIPARALGAEVGRPAPLGAVIAPSYRPDVPSELAPISRAEALTELIHQGFNVEAFGGGRAVDLLAGALEGARCYRLTVATLADAVSAVLEAVSL